MTIAASALLPQGHTGRAIDGLDRFDRLLSGRMALLRSRDAAGAWCWSHVARQQRLAATPAAAPRLGHEAANASVSISAGVAVQGATWSPSCHGLQRGFPKPPDRSISDRPTLAFRPPVSATLRRPPGELSTFGHSYSNCLRLAMQEITSNSQRPLSCIAHPYGSLR